MRFFHFPLLLFFAFFPSKNNDLFRILFCCLFSVFHFHSNVPSKKYSNCLTEWQLISICTFFESLSRSFLFFKIMLISRKNKTNIHNKIDKDLSALPKMYLLELLRGYLVLYSNWGLPPICISFWLWFRLFFLSWFARFSVDFLFHVFHFSFLVRHFIEMESKCSHMCVYIWIFICFPLINIMSCKRKPLFNVLCKTIIYACIHILNCLVLSSIFPQFAYLSNFHSYPFFLLFFTLFRHRLWHSIGMWCTFFSFLLCFNFVSFIMCVAPSFYHSEHVDRYHFVYSYCNMCLSILCCLICVHEHNILLYNEMIYTLSCWSISLLFESFVCQTEEIYLGITNICNVLYVCRRNRLSK